MAALVKFSEDPSAEVRFWCVFAIGQRFVRRRKTRLAVVRALEALLGDLECPDIGGNVAGAAGQGRRRSGVFWMLAWPSQSCTKRLFPRRRPAGLTDAGNGAVELHSARRIQR